MNRMNHRLSASTHNLRSLAALAVLLTTLLGAAIPAAAQDDDMVSVSVAMSIDCFDTGRCDAVLYVPITATTLDGTFLDTCTVTDYPQEPLPGCSVRVPAGTIVVLTEDASALPAGYAPAENPIYFDTADVGRAQYDTGFHNIYQGEGDTTGETSGVITPSDSGGSTGTAQRTWAASVQVVLCDGSPDSSTCQPGPGITVDISLASGEWMGSCTTSEPTPTPWDVFISTCAVEGLPYYEDFVATQDPATIPPGYVPFKETLTLHVEGIHPGGGDGPIFGFANFRSDAEASTSNSSATAGSAGVADPTSLLPSIADVPGGLVETGRHTRPLPEVVANYTDAAETTQLFTGWGWQGNAVASFALPSGQQAQSGQVNGVYVSIHQFGDAGTARAALDFSLTEQAAGTVLQEITTTPLGEYTRSLYGLEDYGYETTVLTQQGEFLIRVSAAMLDGDPTADAVAVTQAILRNVTAPQATMIDQDASGSASSGSGTTSTSTSTESDVGTLWMGCGPMEACIGATITATTQDGQFISSCTMTQPAAPFWCRANNIPRGIIVVLAIDGVASGYMAEQNPIMFDTTSMRGVPATPMDPGDGISFSLVLTDGSASSGTSSSVITADPRGSGEATLLMTFRGCPEGFDPAIGDFFSECTEPLDAPNNAFLDYHGEGQGGMNIAWMDRQYNGEYIYTAGPSTMNVELSGLAPVVRDDYQVFGADGADGDGYIIHLADGETREVYVFYWFN